MATKGTETDPIQVVVHSSPFLDRRARDEKIALVILNSPIRSPPSPLFQTLWNTANFRVCADGGANRLHRANSNLIPDLIRGDLDSLKSNVREYYKSEGVSIERDPCQDTNDLDKALSAVRKQNPSRVIIYGAFGGRFDQEMGCLQALYKWGPQFDYQMVLYDDNTSAFLMPSGVKNEIWIPRYGDTITDDVLGEGPTCGLIPIGCQCDSVVTTGFKWNLDGTIPLAFGGLVSTSNHISEQVATVVCSHPLVFTAEVASGLEDSF